MKGIVLAYPDNSDAVRRVSGRRGNTAVYHRSNPGSSPWQSVRYSGGAFRGAWLCGGFRWRNQYLTGGYFHRRRDFWLRLSAIFLYCLHRGLRIQPQQLDLFPPETDEIQLLITETSQSYRTPLRVTVHWCPANCNIRNPHLKFCFAKGGLLTPETCSYAAKQQVFHC